MIIAIVGYFTVPTVAGYIIQPGGKEPCCIKVSNMSGQAGSAAGGVVTKNSCLNLLTNPSNHVSAL